MKGGSGGWITVMFTDRVSREVGRRRRDLKGELAEVGEGCGKAFTKQKVSLTSSSPPPRVRGDCIHDDLPGTS